MMWSINFFFLSLGLSDKVFFFSKDLDTQIQYLSSCDISVTNTLPILVQLSQMIYLISC